MPYRDPPSPPDTVRFELRSQPSDELVAAGLDALSLASLRWALALGWR